MNEKDLKSKRSSSDVIKLNLENLNACMELDQIALKGLWSKKQWEKELTESQRLCLGIFDSSNLIAFGCGWIVIDELHITYIAVHPNYRRLGLAQIVLSNLFLQAANAGCKWATLEVKSRNKAALSLYKCCGFKTTGVRRNYYKNGSDALIQWKSLEL